MQRRRLGMATSQFLAVTVVVAAAVCCFYYYLSSKTETNKRAETIAHVLAVETALQKYCVDCAGGLPRTRQGLEALYTRPTVRPIPSGWRGPYLQDRAILLDGWGVPLKYVCPGRPLEKGSDRKYPYSLWSQGRDGSDGGTGLDRDIRSWERSTLLP